MLVKNQYAHKASNTKIKLHATAYNGQDILLNYFLYDHELANRWKELIINVSNKNIPPRNNGDFYGSNYFTRDQLVQQFNDDIKIVKSFYPNFKFSVVPHEKMTQSELDLLHLDFENLIPLLHKHKNLDTKLQSAVDDINLSVHRFESLLGKLENSYVQLIFDPTSYIPFHETEYSLFSLDMYFGHLYLGYGLTGTPVHSAFLSKSKIVPKLQNVFSEGMFLFLGASRKFNRWEELDSWLLSAYGWTREKKDLTLGHIPLGFLTSDNENITALRYLMHKPVRFTKVEIGTV